MEAGGADGMETGGGVSQVRVAQLCGSELDGLTVSQLEELERMQVPSLPLLCPPSILPLSSSPFPPFPRLLSLPSFPSMPVALPSLTTS